MRLLLIAALAAAAPAVANAAPCQSGPTLGAVAIGFPKNDGTDLSFAREMVQAVFAAPPEQKAAAPRCERGEVPTPQGMYRLTGENSDALPRRAVGPLGVAGPVVYLATTDAADAPARRYALVVSFPDGEDLVAGFYSGIPDDESLRRTMAGALTIPNRLIQVNLVRRMVAYPFMPAGGANPPPPINQSLPGGGTISSGPQVLIAGPNGLRFMSAQDQFTHVPSGFKCPERVEGASVVLASIDADRDMIECLYRSGTDLAYDPDAEIPYRVLLVQSSDTVAQAMRDFTASAPRGARPHPAPLEPGRAPLPTDGRFVISEGRTAGGWFAKKEGWIILVGVAYDTSPATDAEAAVFAKALFAQAFAAVRAPDTD